MRHNIAREDLDAVIEYLKQDDPILTHSKNVAAFEEEWSDWLGVKYSVMVNSGSSANLLTIATLKETRGLGEIIVPPLTWSSDVASVLQCGFTPVFADINPRTLGMAPERVVEKLTPRTKAVFLTHVLGFNALTRTLLDELAKRNIPLIEDVSESHGATFNGGKLGTFGLMSNFSFYYAHHLSTIEGGMISTNDPDIYQVLRMMRSHGMVRESNSDALRGTYARNHPDLNPDFIFAYGAYNVRPTEINGIIGRSQLKRLDGNNQKRRENLRVFLDNLDSSKYRTDFETEGNCNYALTLVLREPDETFCERVMHCLRSNGVEFRRGTAGGGNQLRQPYLKRVVGETKWEEFPAVNHIHLFGFYIGNYPDLLPGKIRRLCALLNELN